MDSMSTKICPEVVHDVNMSSINATYLLRARRLAHWMESQNPPIGQAELARRIGRTRSYVSALVNEKSPFGENIARDIEDALRMPSMYLDQSDERGLSQIVVWDRVEDLPPDTYAMVPFVSIQLSAGDGRIVDGEEIMPPLAFRKDWLSKKNITSKKNLRTCTVVGDSMEDFLQDGDTVLIDMGQNTIKDHEVYAIEFRGEVKIKRLCRTIDGGVEIHSDNHRHHTQYVTPSQAESLRILGRLVWRAG